MRFVLNLRGTHEMQIMKASLGTGFLYEMRVEEMSKDDTPMQEFSLEASLERLREFFTLGKEMVDVADRGIEGWDLVRSIGSGQNQPATYPPPDWETPLSEEDLSLPPADPADPLLSDEDLSRGK